MSFEEIAQDCTHAPFRAQQKSKEFGELLRMAYNADRILEIGTYKGGTLKGFLKVASDNAVVIGVDLPMGPFGGGWSGEDFANIQTLPSQNQELYLLPVDSHLDSTFEEVQGILDGKMLDVLFIDGDHTYQGVLDDFALYSPLVREGGIIAFHDILEHPNHPNVHVKEFWDELKQQNIDNGFNYKIDEFVDYEFVSDHGIWGGIGVVTMGKRDISKVK